MNVPQHVAIILDGSGRWAKKKGMPRNYGHAPVSYTHLDVYKRQIPYCLAPIRISSQLEPDSGT